ncbi:unnamed protein product [Peronospora destructor]|nr:unnamed protein product [Peronospora destructor]
MQFPPPRHQGRGVPRNGIGSNRQRDSVPPLDSRFDPRYDQLGMSSFDSLGADGVSPPTPQQRGGSRREPHAYAPGGMGLISQDGMTQSSMAGTDGPFTQMAQTQSFSQISSDKFGMSQDSFGYEHDYKSQNIPMSQNTRHSGSGFY